MRNAIAILRKELRVYFTTPVAYVVLAVFTIVASFFFLRILTHFQRSVLVGAQVRPQVLQYMNFTDQVISPLMVNIAVILVFAVPFITMRLVAEERQTGTMTLLNTSPVHDRQIVLGKFLSAFSVIIVMTLLTLYMPLWILVRGTISLGQIALGYTGLLLLGAASVAVGLFASALARSQVVAVILGASIMAPLLMLWMLARAADPPLNGLLSGLALHHENFRPFIVGILDPGSVIYYLAVTYFFLLAATKTLEARRWR